MGGPVEEQMLDMAGRVEHELADVLVVDPVPHGGPFAPSRDKVGEAHLGEVLRDAGDRSLDGLGELAHRELGVEEEYGDPEPGRVGEDPEHLDGEGDDVVVNTSDGSGRAGPLAAPCMLAFIRKE